MNTEHEDILEEIKKKYNGHHQWISRFIVDSGCAKHTEIYEYEKFDIFSMVEFVKAVEKFKQSKNKA